MTDLNDEYQELSKRVWTLLKPPDSDRERHEQITVLLGLIQRITNELSAIKSVLTDKGLLDDSFNKVVAQKMLGDHGGPGPDPLEYAAYYPYLMPEQLYLKEVLELSDEEIADFNKKAKGREILT